MKEDTRSFYERAVERAVVRIAHTLGEALDLESLAREAALSPFHFHRVFRGMLGETPLEMHRRLRLERAARQLLSSDAAVTRVAFDAGYETHEAFTRAFRAAYARSPSAFREGAPGRCELAARSGIHVDPQGHINTSISYLKGAAAMNVAIESLPAMRLATIAHVGPYSQISDAFGRLGVLAAAAGLFQLKGAQMVALYHDDPESTPAAELRSDAAIVVPEAVALPTELVEKRVAAGRFARTEHRGPYTRIGDTWARFMGEWLPGSGQRVGQGPPLEIYRNDPSRVPSEELLTDLYLPLDSA